MSRISKRQKKYMKNINFHKNQNISEIRAKQKGKQGSQKDLKDTEKWEKTFVDI